MYKETEQSQRNEPSLHWSIKFAIVIGVLGLLTGCIQANTPDKNETATPTSIPATATEFIIPVTGTTENLPYITNNYFEMGKENPVKLNAPFTASLPLETAVALTYGEIKNYHMDIPMLVTDRTWHPGQVSEYDQNGRDNSEGNKYLVVQTDNPNHHLILSHSGNASSIGKAIYMAGYIESLGNKTDLLEKQIIFDFNGMDATGTIVDVLNIPTEEFYSAKNWSDPNVSPIMFAHLKELGLSQTSDEANKYRITFATCNFADPGKPSLEETWANLSYLDGDTGSAEYSAIQTLMTVEFTLP